MIWDRIKRDLRETDQELSAIDEMALKEKTDGHRLSLLELLTEQKLQYFSTKKNFEAFERKYFIRMKNALNEKMHQPVS